MAKQIERLYAAVQRARRGDPAKDATARLLASDHTKIAKKVIEEASEVSLACVRGKRKEVVRETADLFYNLTVLLVAMGITPEQVWKEMADREAKLGMAGKRPKNGAGGLRSFFGREAAGGK